jgi:uncharacterized Zn ribbon protein
MEAIKYICPNCGHEFEQGEYNFNYDTSLLDFECPDCGWSGTEKSVEREDNTAYDVEGREIMKGDKVIWTDPETGHKAKYEVFGEPNAEMVQLTSRYGECEALPSECLVIS